MTVSVEVYRYPHQPSRMVQKSVVFERAVGPDPAGGEELWVAAKPKGFWLMQFPLAPSEKQHGFSQRFAIRKAVESEWENAGSVGTVLKEIKRLRLPSAPSTAYEFSSFQPHPCQDVSSALWPFGEAAQESRHVPLAFNKAGEH